MYFKGILIKDIALHFNKSSSTIQYWVTKLGVNKRKHCNMIDRYNVKEIIRENNETYFIKECSICKKNKKILSHTISIKNKYTWCCIDCYLHTDKINNEIANQARKNTNTSGFIGVCAKQVHGKVLGYQVRLIYKNINLMYQLYKDETLNKKTLIQAAVDRDLFIIEKSLPHRRNFTDKELFANMLYLGYEQVDNIKNILEQKDEIQKQKQLR